MLPWLSDACDLIRQGLIGSHSVGVRTTFGIDCLEATLRICVVRDAMDAALEGVRLRRVRVPKFQLHDPPRQESVSKCDKVNSHVTLAQGLSVRSPDRPAAA